MHGTVALRRSAHPSPEDGRVLYELAGTVLEEPVHIDRELPSGGIKDRRECSADVAWLEGCYRSRLDGREPVFLGRQSKGTVWRRPDGAVEIDDSYYRQFGVPRALAVAGECGYAPVGDAATWLVLRRVESDGHS